MNKQKIQFFILIASVLFGFAALAQNIAPDSLNPPEPSPLPAYATEPAQPSTVVLPLPPNDAPTDGAPSEYEQYPEFVAEEASPEIYQNSPPPIVSNRPTLSDGNNGQDYGVEWTEEDIQNQAVIAQTQHRKREIDPLKRNKLIELSRVFGALHAHRVSCVGQGDQTYRARMTRMLDMEAPAADFIREPLIAAFNSGFRAGGNGQSACPEGQETREAFLAADGYKLAIAMAQFYRLPPSTKSN